jgi:hypothetical protein
MVGARWSLQVSAALSGWVNGVDTRRRPSARALQEAERSLEWAICQAPAALGVHAQIYDQGNHTQQLETSAYLDVLADDRRARWRQEVAANRMRKIEPRLWALGPVLMADARALYAVSLLLYPALARAFFALDHDAESSINLIGLGMCTGAAAAAYEDGVKALRDGREEAWARACERATKRGLEPPKAMGEFRAPTVLDWVADEFKPSRKTAPRWAHGVRRAALERRDGLLVAYARTGER